MIHCPGFIHPLLKFAGLLLLLLPGAGAQAQTLDLRDIIPITVASHPSTAAQRALQEGARVDVDTARQQFYPTPSVAIENARSGTGSADGTVQTYRLQQPLWTAGRLTAGMDKAQANLRTAAHDLDETAQQLALRAAQAWGEWYAASLKQDALRSSLETHQRLYEQLQRRVDSGASAPADLVLTEGRVAQTRSQYLSVQAQQRAARTRISQLMGQMVPEDVLPTQSLVMPLQSLASIEDAALSRSPGLQRQASVLEARRAELKEREAELRPEVYLRAERLNGSYSGLAATTGTVNRLTFGLTSRFGAGLSSLTAVEALRKRMEAAEAETEALRRTLREQVQSDWELWRSLQERLPALERNLQASRVTAEAWDRQFLAGRKSWMEVMNTARELAQAELELADARTANAVTAWRLTILSVGWQSAVQASKTPPPSQVRPAR